MSSLDASQTNVETLKSAELLSGLVSGLPAGLIFGLVVRPVTANTCSPAFAIASLWLGVQRRLPFHSIGFLDDAYRLGLCVLLSAISGGVLIPVVGGREPAPEPGSSGR